MSVCPCVTNAFKGVSQINSSRIRGPAGPEIRVTLYFTVELENIDAAHKECDFDIGLFSTCGVWVVQTLKSCLFLATIDAGWSDE